MRILIVGNSHSASVFAKTLSENKNNLVFSTSPFEESYEGANFVDTLPTDVLELKEFALANEIEMTVLCDTELMSLDFVKEFNNANLTIFAPDPDAVKIVSSRGFGKKFMYKNKIQTPKFSIHDKMSAAVEYARASDYPLVISSDEYQDEPKVYKTFAKAFTAIEKLFDEGAKKVVFSEFTDGREFSYYIITDGYNVMPLDTIATLDEKFAYLDALFVDDDLENKILKNVIKPALSALEHFNTAYVGILAVDFVLTDRNELFALEFRPFFNDLDIELFASSVEEDWAKLFNSAIVGSLLDDYSSLKKSGDCYIVAKSGDNYILETGRTLNEAREKLFEFGDIKEVCGWKF